MASADFALPSLQTCIPALRQGQLRPSVTPVSSEGPAAVTYSLENARSLLAIAAILFVCWLFSENKRRFPLVMALGAVAVQAGLVAALFAFPQVQPVLSGIADAFNGLAAATDQGTRFVFSYLGGGDQPYAVTTPDGSAPFVFAFRVLPLILVISALSALLWHWGILKIIIRAFGLLFQKTMGIGGASATAAAANIFMGMVESPIVIKGYLEKLTRSEIFMMMVLGLGTVAGSTLVAYALFLRPVLENAAAHVLVASIISAPACVLLARVMIPEAPGQGGAVADYASDLTYQSSMDAISRGTMDGLQVVLNIAATLIVFVALVALANALLSLAPPVMGAELTLQRIFGWAFAPLAWLMGISWADAQAAGQLLGTKLFLTEFIAFIDLSNAELAISERTRMIMTYAICGFANVGSVGIMVAGMTALFPADRRGLILELAWKSLLPGFLATMMTASVVAAMPEAMFR
jgi:concentrative nucleoside transporter, CNT family